MRVNNPHNSQIILTLLYLFISTALPGAAFAGIVKGKITDFDTGEPVKHATIRVEGTGRSTLANEQGEYRISLEKGLYDLKFSHIGHYSEKLEIEISDSTIIYNVKLRPSMLILKPLKVYERRYDPAQRIIIEAIRRKEDILSQIHDYSVEAYARMVVRDTAKPDTTDILIIAESQIKYYWEQPDKYKEIITARKQTANLDPENVLLSVGGILNLNLNRIILNNFSIVSPTAEDALDHYNYYLLDTIYIDSQTVFRLEIEPQSESEPLFVGTISIADSTYNVVGVDVGFNSALSLPFIDSLRMGQTFAEFEGEYWMPIEQRIKGVADFGFPGLPVMDFDYVASLYKYLFEQGHPDGTFDEYILEVAEDADDVDSTMWLEKQTVPLSDGEIRAYERIDSVANAPKPVSKKLLSVAVLGLATALDGYDYFHFNAVEGAYVGGRFSRKKIISDLDVDLKTGYAIDAELWEHSYFINYTLSDKPRLKLMGGYRDKIKHAPTIISGPDYNPTLPSITNKTDPFDYYREKGFEVGFSIRPLRGTTLSAKYHDFDQISATNSTEYSLFRKSKIHRINPSISEGRMRAISGELVWDSRSLMRNKKEEFYLSRVPYTIAKIGIKYADRDFISNDFSFTRYYASLYRKQRTLGLGVTTIFAYGGESGSCLPVQENFTIDFGNAFIQNKIGFKTMYESNFSGNRAAALYLEHNFGRVLFLKSGLPVINKLPFTLSVHGGVFWHEIENIPEMVSSNAFKPYREIGFGVGGILPLTFEMHFTWQLSDYDTRRFMFNIVSGFSN